MFLYTNWVKLLPRRTFSLSKIFLSTTNNQTPDSGRISDVSSIEEFLSTEQSSEKINLPNVRAISKVLLDKGASVQNISHIFRENPQLTTVQVSHWERLLEVFSGMGLDIRQSLKVIRGAPIFLGCSTERIFENANCLQNVGVKNYLSYIAENPNLLQLKAKEILEQVEWLKTIFSNKDVDQLVNNCPNVFTELKSSLTEKIQYIMFRMNLRPDHIVRANALNYTLQHIAIRHEFLKRAGIYTLPNPKFRLVIYNNPSLKAIVTTNDNDFAKKIAKVGLEEYQVFCKLALTEDFWKLEPEETDPEKNSYHMKFKVK